MQSFRREDLLREVIIPSLPELPVAHGSSEAAKCADALAWTLEVIGQDEPEGLLPLLSRLPVACTDGWFPIAEAVFGPGWAGRCGDHLKALADGLPEEKGEEFLRSALLPPGNERWLQRGNQRYGVSDPNGIELANRGDQFARAGVVDGLRLEALEPISFGMSKAAPKLPDKAPVGIPQAAWDDWKTAVLPQVKPQFKNWLKHELQGVKVLPDASLRASRRFRPNGPVESDLGFARAVGERLGGSHDQQELVVTRNPVSAQTLALDFALAAGRLW